jgi:hypothetical protein
MYDFLAPFYANLSLTRIIYSLILLAIIFVLFSHLVSIWSHGKISVSDFSYYLNGKKDSEHAEQLRSETLANYSMIVDLITDELRQTDDDDCSRTDNTWYRRIFRKVTATLEKDDSSSVDEPDECKKVNQDQGQINPQDFKLTLPNDALEKIEKTIDITIEGVSLKGLFSAFSTAFSNFVAPPKTELVASIYATDEAKRVYISAVGGASPRDDARSTTKLTSVASLETPTSERQTAFRIACYLVWIQINKDGALLHRSSTANDDANDHPRVSFEELCDWANIVSARRTLEATDRYRLDARKKLLDIELIERSFARAVRAEISFRNIYTSLSGFEDFIGPEPIKLNDRVETTVAAVADLVRYLAITLPKPQLIEEDDDEDRTAWLALLKSPLTTPQAVAQAYFSRTVHTACEPDAGVPDDVLKVKSNVVRITSFIETSAKKKRPVVTTGLAIGDGLVLTLVLQLRDTDDAASRFESATVDVSQCGQPASTMEVTSAMRLTPAVGRSPYVLLSVPTLKANNPERNLEALTEDQKIFVAGYAPDVEQMFGESSASSPYSGTLHFLSGRVLGASPRFHIGRDTEHNVYLSAPFARGLVGAPIFDEDGELIGFVNGGAGVGAGRSGILLSVASAIATLADLPARKNSAAARDNH